MFTYIGQGKASLLCTRKSQKIWGNGKGEDFHHLCYKDRKWRWDTVQNIWFEWICVPRIENSTSSYLCILLQHMCYFIVHICFLFLVYVHLYLFCDSYCFYLVCTLHRKIDMPLASYFHFTQDPKSFDF